MTVALSLLGSMFISPCAFAQNDAADPAIRINLPSEVEIKTLIDYVGSRVGVKILYDEKLANKKLSIRATEDIPASSLVSLMQSALRMKGLALVDTDTPGWKKIVDAAKLNPEWATDEDAQALVDRREGATAVTQVFTLKHADPVQVDALLKPLASSQPANTIVLKEQRLLIVTDYASNLVRMTKLLELIDRPRQGAKTEFITLEHADADAIATQITSMIDARSKAEGTATTSTANDKTATAASSGAVSVFPFARANQLIVVGDQGRVDEVKDFIQQLDIPTDATTEIYTTQSIPAERLDRLIRSVLETERGGLAFKTTVDQEWNSLIVNAPPSIHAKIEAFIKRHDGAKSAESTSRIKFHKLKHITAEDALETIRGMEQGSAPQGRQRRGGGAGGGTFQDGLDVRAGQFVPGPNRPQLQPEPFAQQPPAFQLQVDQNGQPLPIGVMPVPVAIPTGYGQGESNAVLQLGKANVTADVNSNTLIVVADPSAQKVYTDIIEALDKPRPQVLIEAKIVILDTSDDFGLGVEFSGGDRSGVKKLFSFTSFGLSTVDPLNGALKIIPGTGLNGTLVDPEVADMVLRAFTKHRRAKVVSCPRVLVADNVEGNLSSTTEIPFTSVNASQTVATTSFAGYAKAGTEITVTPHISEKDQLQLDYEITLNDFQGAPSSANVPPPRQTDKVKSIATIPNGHTLIVGGLNRTSFSQTVDSFPFIENIPLIRHAFSNDSQRTGNSSLFIFLRPVILRDDKFRDFKYFSERDVRRATIPGDLPSSRPMLMR